MKNVLLSNRVNYWTGDEGLQFEEEFASYLGVEFAVAVANGTVALECALRALDIGPGDEVIGTPRTFVASASSVLLVGATPVFADVDLNSQNITAETISKVLTENTKAIILVHLGGVPCDMKGIMALARARNIKVIEDCAQAHGAKYNGKKIGTFGDVACWSFCQDKIITTGGEGGMVVTQNRELYERIWALKDHGKSRGKLTELEYLKDRSFKWIHDSLGSNLRMTEMQSALGRYQLKLLDEWVAERKQIASYYHEAFSAIAGIRIPFIGDELESAWYKFYVFIDVDVLVDGWGRDRIRDALNDNDIPCTVGSCPEVYLEKAIKENLSQPVKRLPNAEALGESSLAFPIHPGIQRHQVAVVGMGLKRVMDTAVLKAEACAGNEK